MSNIVVPRGREVRFKQQGEPLPGTEDVELILEQDFQFALSSQFGPLSGGGGKAFSVLGGITRDTLGFGFSGQFRQMGYQVWQKTDPLSASINVGLYMKTNALKDVVRPAIALMKVPLPDDSDADEGNDGFGLIPPGPSIIDALGDSDDSVRRGQRVSVRIGRFFIPNIIIQSVEPSFASQPDDQDYPVYIQLTIQISTVFTATSSMMDQLLEEG